jgi:hypothetical protein
MKWKQTVVILIICVISARLHAGVAILAGSEPIRQMFKEASLVCRCSVLSVKILRKEKIPGDLHGNTINVMSALLREEMVYKTDQKDFQNITLVYEEEPFSDMGLQGGESDRLFFLKGKGTEYAFVAPREAFRMPPRPTIESTSTGLEQLETDLVAGLETGDRNILLNTLRLLQALDGLSPASISVLKHLLANSDTELALAVHAVLIKTGDPEEVVQFAAFEEKSINVDFVRSISIGSSIRLMSIGSSLNRTRSETALPALAKLADSPTEVIRLGALDAIRLIKNTKSIPVLIKHLDDSNQFARYVSAISLSEITKKNNMPFMGDFEKDESKYLGVWKTWWEQEGRALYDPSPKNPPH